MAWTKDQVDRALADIVQRTQHDPAFRQLCLQNPAAAVREVTDEALPPGFRLRFIDNDHADLVVVLPDPVASDELSDEALSAVSGGIQGAGMPDKPKVRGLSYTSPLVPGACFAAGTPVLIADGTWQPIEAIGPGDTVLSFDEEGRRVVTTRVNKRLDHSPEPLYRAVIEDLDRELLVTPNHPFYVEGRWCRIGNLAPHSKLFFFDAKRGASATRRLLALEPTGHRAPVFNFEVNEAHTYFVDGVLVHNGGPLDGK